jgi:sugar phosphate isomerase/epimerase
MRMALDVAHSNLRSETFDFLKTHGDKIEHIHVSDNRGRKDQHLAIGEGDIDWPTVVEAIKSTGFENWLVVESYKDVKESIEYLYALI